MPKRFIVAVLAAAIALTGLSSAPARAADQGELARLIFGAGALLMLNQALTNNNKRTVTRRYVEPDHDYDVRPRRDGRPRHEFRPRHVVPSACLRVNHSDYGPRQYFGRHCLRNNMRNFSALPGQCRTSVWTRNGNRTVFGAHCLRRNGWVMG